MAHKYVVYVATPGEWPPPEVRRQLGQRLKLPEEKLEVLLSRLPAEVTKPVPEATALAVAGHFRNAGLDAAVRPVDVAPAAPPTVNTGPGIEQPEEPRSYEESDATSPAGSEGPDQVDSQRRPATREPTESATAAAAPAADSHRERATGEDDWAGEFRHTKGKGAEPEEELLPESALSTEKQTKAPSLALLIALVVVMTVLAALWLLL